MPSDRRTDFWSASELPYTILEIREHEVIRDGFERRGVASKHEETHERSRYDEVLFQGSWGSASLSVQKSYESRGEQGVSRFHYDMVEFGGDVLDG